MDELKASDAYGGRGPWANISPEVRDDVYKTILDWMKERYCKLAVCPIDSGKFFYLKKGGCDLSKTFQYPYEAGAMNIVLSIQKHQKSQKNNKGNTIIIFDEQKEHDKNVLKLFEQDLSYTDSYTGYKVQPRAKNPEPRLNQIVDVPHFSKSHPALLTQLADWVAFVVNRYIRIKSFNFKEAYAGELSKIEEWYGQIKECLITHTCIDPPGKDKLCEYYRQIRPDGWSAKKWFL